MGQVFGPNESNQGFSLRAYLCPDPGNGCVHVLLTVLQDVDDGLLGAGGGNQTLQPGVVLDLNLNQTKTDHLT